jgi:hypothetical protein
VIEQASKPPHERMNRVAVYKKRWQIRQKAPHICSVTRVLTAQQLLFNRPSQRRKKNQTRQLAPSLRPSATHAHTSARAAHQHTSTQSTRLNVSYLALNRISREEQGRIRCMNTVNNVYVLHVSQIDTCNAVPYRT